MLKPYYEDAAAGITIYCGDCREILPQLGKFDLLLSDPPFGTGETSRGYGRMQNYNGDHGRKIANDENLTVTFEGLTLAQKQIENGYGLVFCSPRKLSEMLTYIPQDKYVGELIWDKGTPGLGYAIRYVHESAILWSIGSPKKQDSPLMSIVRAQVGRIDAHLRHPHEKPVDFWLNAMNLPGQRIIDPFMGTGSVLRAAKDIGRWCVGIEIDENYCEAAVEKLRQQTLQLLPPPMLRELYLPNPHIDGNNRKMDANNS